MKKYCLLNFYIFCSWINKYTANERKAINQLFDLFEEKFEAN